MIRPGAALPDGRLPADLDGKWIAHLGDAPIRMTDGLSFPAEYLHALPTGRIEARETRLIEGGTGGFEIAEVFEVNP